MRSISMPYGGAFPTSRRPCRCSPCCGTAADHSARRQSVDARRWRVGLRRVNRPCRSLATLDAAKAAAVQPESPKTGDAAIAKARCTLGRSGLPVGEPIGIGPSAGGQPFDNLPRHATRGTDAARGRGVRCRLSSVLPLLAADACRESRPPARRSLAANATVANGMIGSSANCRIAPRTGRLSAFHVGTLREADGCPH